MAVRHLAALGHRQIGVVTTLQSPTAPHVRRGWRQACEELGLRLDGALDVTTVDQRHPEWPKQLDEVLDKCLASGATALLVHSDPEAISLVERCQERGIRMPGDLAVVTYDDEVAELCDPPLTAVRPPKWAIGRAAFAMLAARLADPDPQRPAHRARHRTPPDRPLLLGVGGFSGSSRPPMKEQTPDPLPSVRPQATAIRERPHCGPVVEPNAA